MFKNLIVVILCLFGLNTIVDAGMGYLGQAKSMGMHQNVMQARSLFGTMDVNSVVYMRGVILQGVARFEDEEGQIVPNEKVIIDSVSTGKRGRARTHHSHRSGAIDVISNAKRSFCVRIGEAHCRTLPLNTPDLIRLARFVRRGGVSAYTAPDAARAGSEKVREIVSRNGLVPIPDEIKDWEGKHTKDYIARELVTSYFVKTLSYIDYDLSFVSRVRDREIADSIVAQTNAELGHNNAPKFFIDIIDKSYVNVDLHAFFAISPAKDAMDLTCRGVPARYYWILEPDADYVYLYGISFARQPNSGDTLQRDALELFCTAALLRGLTSEQLAKIK
ncbi:MAG: hypothetical protein CVV06_05110 [Gammaproteobacteria bacterium HGW-Gammaproteobacteria-10]|nr:MAG: hypothetical protein CVV06_05110 [Gammaproteobacteria bacterium HGW-Gammaproteobacteria-10]